MIQSNNINRVFYKKSEYKAIYVGINEIWARTVINLKGFLKYNYENIGLKFVKYDETSDENAPYDQMYSFKFDTDWQTIDNTISYNYDSIIQFNTDNISTEFILDIVTGEFDQAITTEFLKYVEPSDKNALYDQMYGFKIDADWQTIDNTISYNYDSIIQFNTDNISTEFDGEVLVYDQSFVYNVNNIAEQFK